MHDSNDRETTAIAERFALPNNPAIESSVGWFEKSTSPAEIKVRVQFETVNKYNKPSPDKNRVVRFWETLRSWFIVIVLGRPYSARERNVYLFQDFQLTPRQRRNVMGRHIILRHSTSLTKYSCDFLLDLQSSEQQIKYQPRTSRLKTRFRHSKNIPNQAQLGRWYH